MCRLMQLQAMHARDLRFRTRQAARSLLGLPLGRANGPQPRRRPLRTLKPPRLPRGRRRRRRQARAVEAVASAGLRGGRPRGRLPLAVAIPAALARRLSSLRRRAGSQVVGCGGRPYVRQEPPERRPRRPHPPRRGRWQRALRRHIVRLGGAAQARAPRAPPPGRAAAIQRRRAARAAAAAAAGVLRGQRARREVLGRQAPRAPRVRPAGTMSGRGCRMRQCHNLLPDALGGTIAH
mmetsp:Transcript_19694/g.68440  ORF Transcript_19694/g.68440 Transcript_19694/m.68440 type:complete len:236 (-) Transcript_19694:83-790(-)